MSSKPSILWIIIDCARFDRISSHGYQRNTTPNIDRLIDQGLDYRNAFSAAIWSLPSYTSLLTGLYPREHGLNVRGKALNPDTGTITNVMSAAGYKTACFSTNSYLDATFGMGTGFDRFERMWLAAQKNILEKADFAYDKLIGILLGEVDKAARRTNKRILRWLRETRGQLNFSVVAYVEPHTPYTNHRKTANIFNERNGLKLKMPFLQLDQDFVTRWAETYPEPYPYPEGLMEEANLRYDIEMNYIDFRIGELITHLQAESLLDNTIVIITADHGELLGEHNMYGHQFSVAEPLRHVPLIIWSPSNWSSSKKIDDVVQSIDLSATICNWCNIEWHADRTGYVLPELNGEGLRKYAITDYPQAYLPSVQRYFPDNDMSLLDIPLICASNQRCKVVHSGENTWYALDLEQDPGEQRSLSIEDIPDGKDLRNMINEHIKKHTLFMPEEVEVPAEVLSHLRDLGYIE